MTIPDIHPDERIDEINEYISLIQKKNGLICSLRLFRGTTNAAPISEAARVSFLFCALKKTRRALSTPLNCRRSLPVL